MPEFKRSGLPPREDPSDFRSGRAEMSAKRLLIRGRVQGVGFRDWMMRKARELGVSGWVRNRSDGTVEALLAGDPAAVEELLRACRRGPRSAQVTSIEERLADPPDDAGFHFWPSL